MLIPREYQIECVESILERRASGINRGLVSLPTGCGKTICFALLAKELNKPTLIIAHRDELIEQAVSKLQMVWPEAEGHIGVVKAERNEIDSQIIVASIQSISRDHRLQKLKEKNFDLMVIDEAHHSASPSYMRVVRELGFLNDHPHKLLVGVSATVRRSDGVGLGNIFQEIVFERSISTMIRAGYLSPLVGKSIITDISLDDISISQGDFAINELSRAVNTPSRNKLILDSFNGLAGDRKKAIGFCADVKHAKDLADTFIVEGIVSKAIYGSMEYEERKQILSDFSSGKIKVLFNCMLLCEGYDETSIDCVLMCRPTRSQSLYIQAVGRGTRIHPAKRDCLILDFCDNASRNDLATYRNSLDGVVTPLDGFKDDDELEEYAESLEEKIVDSRPYNEAKFLEHRIEDIEFFGRAEFAWVPVGDSWHLRLSADRDVWVRQIEGGFLCVAHADGKTFNLSSRPLPLDYGLGVCEDWARKQTTKSAWARKDAAWRKQPATPKQIETLAKMKIEFNHGISRGEASQLLDLKFNESATEKQIYWLRKRGIAFDPNITKLEARKIIGSNNR